MTIDTPETYDQFIEDLRATIDGMPRPLDVWGVVFPIIRRRYSIPSADVACALADRLHEEFDWGNRYA